MRSLSAYEIAIGMGREKLSPNIAIRSALDNMSNTVGGDGKYYIYKYPYTTGDVLNISIFYLCLLPTMFCYLNINRTSFPRRRNIYFWRWKIRSRMEFISDGLGVSANNKRMY